MLIILDNACVNNSIFCATDSVFWREPPANPHDSCIHSAISIAPLAARAGVEPTTLRLKAIDSIKAQPCLTMIIDSCGIILSSCYEKT